MSPAWARSFVHGWAEGWSTSWSPRSSAAFIRCTRTTWNSIVRHLGSGRPSNDRDRRPRQCGEREALGLAARLGERIDDLRRLPGTVIVAAPGLIGPPAPGRWIVL